MFQETKEVGVSCLNQSSRRVVRKESSPRVCPSEVSAFDRTRRKGRDNSIDFLAFSLSLSLSFFRLVFSTSSICLYRGRGIPSLYLRHDTSLLFATLPSFFLFFFLARNLNQFPTFFVKSPIAMNFTHLCTTWIIFIRVSFFTFSRIKQRIRSTLLRLIILLLKRVLQFL